MTTAAQLREMRRSESCRWLPVSAPRPIIKGVCVMRAKRRAPSGETTSRTASPVRGAVSGMGHSQCGNCNTRGAGQGLRADPLHPMSDGRSLRSRQLSLRGFEVWQKGGEDADGGEERAEVVDKIEAGEIDEFAEERRADAP